MTWRDSLRPASFRGVPFKVEGHERTGGRKAVVHEYPQQDDDFVEDLGRKGRGFTVEAYIVGPDYFAERDALLEALERPGPGQLVHPYFGTLEVALLTYRLRETREEGGLVRFALTFHESKPKAAYPRSVVNPVQRVETQADGSLEKVGEVFRRVYSTGGQPQFSVNSLENVLSSASSDMGSIFGSSVTDTQGAAGLSRLASDFSGDASSLARSASGIFDGLSGIFSAFRSSASSSRSAFNAYNRGYLITPGAARPPATTATRRIERANYDALTALVRQMNVIEAARVAPTVEYETYEEAIASRDLVLARLDAEADAADDEIFDSVQALRAAVAAAVPGPDSGLARLIPVTPQGTTPSLAVAYDLYGDLESEGDIVARNRIRHPGFITGGRQLQVLSRG